MKRLNLALALMICVSGFVGIALANIATYTTDGKNVIVYDTVTNKAFVTNMDLIAHEVLTNHSLYWVQVNSAAQEALDAYEDRVNNKTLNGTK